jgi:hypothetical protein
VRVCLHRPWCRGGRDDDRAEGFGGDVMTLFICGSQLFGKSVLRALPSRRGLLGPKGFDCVRSGPKRPRAGRTAAPRLESDRPVPRAPPQHVLCAQLRIVALGLSSTMYRPSTPTATWASAASCTAASTDYTTPWVLDRAQEEPAGPVRRRWCRCAILSPDPGPPTSPVRRSPRLPTMSVGPGRPPVRAWTQSRDAQYSTEETRLLQPRDDGPGRWRVHQGVPQPSERACQGVGVSDLAH